ncbi:hypothetical protein NDU88_004600 [Pleurodeles waltl]|uniref:Uncharacterized protein n=1 Tax=Pleurodeles waltl TaxID=8319 RepID=A0AAV7W9E2_PLEWA|nr:hypothetical protein NDU88_004600 [Pleurodeles waltl]
MHYPGAPQQKPDILDIVVMKNVLQSIELETLAALTSDQNPVLVTVGDKIECQQQGKDIDQAVECFTDAVHTAIKGSISQQTPQCWSIYDLPSGIKHSITEKNRARRQWQKYRTPDLLKTQISQHRGEKWEAAARHLKDSDNSLWRMTWRLTGRKETNPPIQRKTHLACSNRDKAEVLADTLETSFKPNQASKLTVEVEQETTKHYLEHFLETEAATIEEWSSDEIRSLIKKLKKWQGPRKRRSNQPSYQDAPKCSN